MSTLEKAAQPFVLGRPPADREELYWLIQAMWGTRIPRTQVCPDHVAPFTAFADAYFGVNSIDPSSPVDSIALWHGSRGLSGKSFMLSILGLTKTHLRGMDCNLLGGSLAQSTNIHEHMRGAMEYRNAPTYMIEDNTGTKVKLTNGAKIRPLTASQRTVRGPHPALLLLDEIDEMDLPILDAALGQPMPQTNWLGQIIDPYTVMCLAEGTAVLTDAGEKPIERVEPGDLVLTRDGWSPVHERIDNGWRPTVSVELSTGRVIHCTNDHRFATETGWITPAQMLPGQQLVGLGDVHAAIESSQLGANSLALATTDDALTAVLAGEEEVLPGQLVASGAVGLHGVQRRGGGAAQDVGAMGDRLEVVRVAASGDSAQVIQRPVVGDLSHQHHVGEAVHRSAVDRAAHHPVAARPGSFPQPALVFADHRASGQEPVTVVRVSAGLLRHVYDLSVMGTPEYVAESVIAHNCSTWQNPQGTFTEMMKRADEQGIPRYTWCYRESANPVDGWLSEKSIAEKKATINKEMWRVEYELGEPAIGNRAFDSEAVERTFSLPFEPLERQESKDFEEYTFAAYERDGDYVIGADWAKEQDYTVITVIRYDRKPYELVYYARLNRRPYPFMIAMFNEAMARYNAQGEYDRTGLGNVVKDYIDVRAHGFHMGGEPRSAMLSEYVNGLERDQMRFPKIPTAYVAHKYAQVGDLYSTSQMYHLPDEVCALALAYYRVMRSVPPASPITVTKTDEPNRYAKIFEPHTREGDVTSLTTGQDTFSLI